jgi:uracil-DNA glycosylase
MTILLVEPEALASRMAALRSAPRMRPLRALAARLRRATGREVPEADPVDGGAEARLLLLLETPAPRLGSAGFVSRDNRGGTAANLRRFLADAGLERGDTLLWNAVPWVIHAPGACNRAPTAAERRAGAAWVPPLLAILPRLAVVVLSGRVAAALQTAIQACRPELSVLCMPHPSPTFVCTSPDVPRRIVAVLAEAATLLREAPFFPESSPSGHILHDRSACHGRGRLHRQPGGAGAAGGRLPPNRSR